MIEAALALAAFTGMITAALFTVYVGFLSVWIDREAYEALVCLGSLSQVYQCESELRKGIETALPIGDLANLHVSRTPANASVSLQFKIGDKDILSWSDSRSLPLGGRKSIAKGFL